MSFDLELWNPAAIAKQATSEILKCNTITAQYGLMLTETQVTALVETRTNALRTNGRIEFGGGIIDKIITEFCDSPYIGEHNYEETLHELIEIFYYYKNETLDIMADNDLLKYMKTSFDGICQGSLELLASRELDIRALNLRSGRSPEFSEDSSSDDWEEGDDEKHRED